jgi:hypothetical protein
MTTLANTHLYPTVFEHIARINNIKGHPYEFYGEGRKNPGAFSLGYCKFPVKNPAFTQILRFTRGAFQVEMAIPDPQPKAGEIEIDPGLKTYLALSNSEIISNLRHPVQADRHLKKLQRDHARTQPGRLRREKAR